MVAINTATPRKKLIVPVIAEGSPSPWGRIDFVQRHKLGNKFLPLYWVTTPSHGGYMIHETLYRSMNLAPDVPAMLFTQPFEISGNTYFCFEEDCDWCLLYLELSAKGFQAMLHTENDLRAPDEVYKMALETVGRHHPKY